MELCIIITKKCKLCESSATLIWGYILNEYPVTREVTKQTSQHARIQIKDLTAMPVDGPQINLASSVCLLYTSPSPRDLSTSRMPSSA